MNGNFEVNKGAYPYSATRFGDSTHVVFTPTQEKITKAPVAFGVGEQIALDLNKWYHGPRVRKAFDMTLSEDRRTVGVSIHASLIEAKAEGRIDGVQYTQLKEALI